MKSMIWAVDVRESAVSAVAAELRPEGPRIIGAGKAATAGIRRGRILHAGDLTESLVEALRRAESAAGARCRGFYYNFDDPEMESRFAQGSRTLPGEGQVTAEDVRLASDMALRLVGDFERCTVYSRETSFMIDGKDPVADPLGVFGRQLDVEVHVILARAAHAGDWKRAVERAQMGPGVSVVSLLSSAHGVLSPSLRQGRRILWDLGEDVLAGCVFDRGGIRGSVWRPSDLDAHATAAWVNETSAELASRHAGVEQSVITGDLAETSMPLIAERSHIPVVLGRPDSLAGLESAQDAALAGLVRLAALMPRDRSRAAQQEWVSGLRQRAEALIKEYF